jgi:hypothetical protein
MSIVKLTPIRNYYSKDIKVMQQVFWDAQLTTTIQTDDFRLIVESICQESKQLSVFTFHQTELPSLDSAGDRHLLRRSYLRRGLYQRSNFIVTVSAQLQMLLMKCEIASGQANGKERV